MTDLERAARAMGDSADKWAAGEGCDDVDILDADMLLEMSAVALEALREPSEEAIEAMALALHQAITSSEHNFGEDGTAATLVEAAHAAHAALFDHLLGGKER